MRALLIGRPVSHSLSPLMQNAAFAAVGLEHRYEPADTAVDELEAAVRRLRDGQHLGANVTVPYKLAAVPLVDEIDADVAALGALNTIVSSGTRLLGYNTDVTGAWEGLLMPILARLDGARVLVLGAGGGARALLMALGRCGASGPARVTVAARRMAMATELAHLGEQFGLACAAIGWDGVAAAVGDISVVVNCTPLGLGGEDPLEGIPLSGRAVLDMAYRPGGTALFRRARLEADHALQGDEMLVRQGARAFQLWTELEPPLDVMRRALAGGLA
ncbi:MAG: shikimate dehydrogenase [Candidatus Dormibacteria bacterium]